MLHQWYFQCQCQRCQDPGSDFGTFINAIRCPKCAIADGNGYLTLSEQSTWFCASCQLSVSGASVEHLVGQFLGALEEIHPGSETAIEDYESFIATAGDHLHKNHFTCLIAKRYLTQLYSLESDSKKIVEVCADLLAVFDILDPGLSQTRGLTTSRLVLAKIKLKQVEEGDLKSQVDLVTRRG